MTILLIRLRLIGDVVFTTPVIGALRRRYPDARLLYLVEESAAPVVAANPDLSSVIVVTHSRGLQRLKDDAALAWRLRRERVDIAIDMHGGPRSAWLTWATHAPVRVGYDVPGRAWMYTDTVHRPRTYQPRHAVVNQWDLLAAVDPALAVAPDPARDRTRMPVVADTALPQFVDAARDTAPRLALLHVSAGNVFRRWPESSFAQVAAALAEPPHDCAVLITAGPSDRAAASRILTEARRLAGSRATRIIDAERLSLTELRAVCDHAALFIGGDSGPLHIASTSDVPIVALYGPTKPERSEPWRPASIPTANVEPGPLPCRPCDQRVCAPGDYRCLTMISPAMVVERAAALLEASR